MAAPRNKYLQLFDEGEPDRLSPLYMAGILSPQSAYRLVWQLNQETDLELVRTEDLYYKRKAGDIYIQCYEYTDDETDSTARLVANQTNNNILIPEHRNTPYFLLLKGEETEKYWQSLLNNLKKATFVRAVYEMDINTLKNKDLLYF